MSALDEAAERDGRRYLAGGATAVLLGWRSTTVDVDVKLVRRALLAEGLVETGRLRAYFDEIEPLLYRFPAIDPSAFRVRVEAVAASG